MNRPDEPTTALEIVAELVATHPTPAHPLTADEREVLRLRIRILELRAGIAESHARTRATQDEYANRLGLH